MNISELHSSQVIVPSFADVIHLTKSGELCEAWRNQPTNKRASLKWRRRMIARRMDPKGELVMALFSFSE